MAMNGRLVTSEEKTLMRELRAQGFSRQAVALRVGRSDATIGRYASGTGRRGRSLSDATVSEVRRLRADGGTAPMVAATLGVSVSVVYKYAPGRVRDALIPMAQRLREEGYSTRQIAEELGVSREWVLKYAPNPDFRVTPAERERIVYLRYVEGMSAPKVATLTGRHRDTIRLIAPGRPRNVDNEPLRAAVERSVVSISEIARCLGWVSSGRSDTTRVRRALGQKSSCNGMGRRSLTRTIRVDLAATIAEAIGLDPHEIAA